MESCQPIKRLRDKKKTRPSVQRSSWYVHDGLGGCLLPVNEFSLFWLVVRLILIDVCLREISLVYTVYDRNKPCCYCEGIYLLRLCLFVFFLLFLDTVKDKAIPLQAWTGP